MQYFRLKLTSSDDKELTKLTREVVTTAETLGEAIDKASSVMPDRINKTQMSLKDIHIVEQPAIECNRGVLIISESFECDEPDKGKSTKT